MSALKVNESSFRLGNNRSQIRDIFEYSKKRANEVGDENVFDFSIGNPSVEPPIELNAEIIRLLNDKSIKSLHGYTSSQGDTESRKKIAQLLSEDSGFLFSEDNIYFTCGAAAALTISINAIIDGNGNDEIIIIKPYFPEYKVFIEGAGAHVVEVNSTKENLRLDIKKIENAISINTRAIIINSPNNPSGVVYSSDELRKLGSLLDRKSQEYNREIILISDEPYRELVYDIEKIPCIFNYYDSVIMCYSYSKSLSLAGERIGYIAISPNMPEWEKCCLAIMGAGRKLGYVNAPSIFQRAVANLGRLTCDVEIYKETRDVLYSFLIELGFKVIKPQGAFYLFMKSEGESAEEFCERAKKFDLLFVPSTGFGVDNYVRIAYCKQKKDVERSLKNFQLLANEYFE